jgi:monoamine oxidase
VPRTPLMRLLRSAVRQCAATTETPVTRRAMLGGGAGLAMSVLLPAAGLAATARIAVVGAGLAGLTAAYRLQQAGYGVDVFEGNTRLGGRCYSARDVFADGQVAEHGGEFFDTGHKDILALAGELGLVLDDVLAATPPNTHASYIVDGKPYSLADATRDWQPLYPVLQAQAKSLGDYNFRGANKSARRFDAMTIAGWVAEYVPGGRTGQLGLLIETAFAEENAADADQQSALNVIGVLAEDPRQNFNLYYTDSDQRFHTRGGNDQIPTRLGERLSARVRTGTKLIAIARRPDGRVRLSLKSDTGVADAIYDRVILALPFSVMRGAVDYSGAGFRPLKVKAIETLPIGASVKFQLQFSQRAWIAQGCTGETRLKSANFQTTWEVTRAQPGASGILNFFSGGTRALNAGALDGAALAAQCLADIEPVIPGLTALWNGRMTKDAWKQNPWSLGSYTYFPPGYQTTVFGVEAEREGNCFFAGEHTSSSPGYMNSAVATGIRAARQVAGSLQQKRVASSG